MRRLLLLVALVSAPVYADRLVITIAPIVSTAVSGCP